MFLFMRQRGREHVRYRRIFRLFSDKGEKAMTRTAIVLFALLLLSQLLLQSPAVRSWVVKVEQLEGVPYRRL
jgi:hypothetical protein